MDIGRAADVRRPSPPAETLKRITQIKPLRDFHEHFYISFRHRYAFHTVGKAANSTVKHIFYKLELSGTRFPMPSVHDRMASPMISPFQLSPGDVNNVLLGGRFLRFTFVRNPYSRILSCYLDRIQDQKSRPYRELMNFMGKAPGYAPEFAEFVDAICQQTQFQQNNHWRVQYADAMGEVVPYDFVGKQEHFDRDIAYLYQRIAGAPLEKGASDVNASPSRTSASKSLRKYWTEDLCRRFLEVYEADFDMFGYDPRLAD